MPVFRPFARTAARTALGLILSLAQVGSSFAGIVKIEGGINARSSMDFRGTENVKAVFPKGTEGEVLERWELPSGNYGIKLKVSTLGAPTTGLAVGDEVWVYYHRDPERRFVELYDDDKAKVEDATKGKWAVALKSFRTSVETKASVQAEQEIKTEPKKTESEKVCTVCNLKTATEVVQPLPTRDFFDLSALKDEISVAFKPTEPAKTELPKADITKTITKAVEVQKLPKKEVKEATKTIVKEDPKDVPVLDISNEEILTYLNKVNPKPKQKGLNETIAKALIESSKAEGVPLEIPLAIMRKETVNFDPRDRSTARDNCGVGARGLMQVMPCTWKQLGGGSIASANDPDKNIRIAMKFVGELYRKYNGNLKYILIAYNAGEGRVPTYKKGGMSALPKETQKYVPAVQKYYADYVAFEKKSKTMLAQN